MREANEKSEWSQFGYFALVLAVLISVLFFLTLPSLEIFTQWDDNATWIRDSALITPGYSSIKTAFAGLIEGQYIPTIWLSFLCDRVLFGTTAFWYHLHSLLGHITCSIVLMALYRLLGMRLHLAFGCALLWAALPSQLTNAAGIATRMIIARNLFSFIALAFFVYAYDKPMRRRWDCLCVCAGLLAVCTGVQCPLLPIMMFAAVFYQCKGAIKTRVTNALKHGFPAIFLVLLAYSLALCMTALNAPMELNCALLHSFVFGVLGLAITRVIYDKTI